MKFFVAILLLCGISPAQARVFDMNKETFGPYFRVSGGTSTLGKTAFEDATGGDETFASEVAMTYSGEFGFLWATKPINLRVAAEMIQPTALLKNKASNAAGDELYSLDSKVSAILLPKVALEFNLRQRQNFRIFAGAAAGMATVTLSNAYTFTSAGQTAFSGISDYTESAKGTLYSAEGFIAFESLLSDTTTFCFDLGYRALKAPTLKFTEDAATIQGAKAAGDNLTNADGNDRAIDLSGVYLGLAFRFYL
jgi:hypothetical protein